MRKDNVAVMWVNLKEIEKVIGKKNKESKKKRTKKADDKVLN